MFGSTACGVVLSAAVLMRSRRSVVDWAFVASMAVLSTISICNSRAVAALNPEIAIFWQQWTFFALSFLPGVWLLFSLSYARGNSREFLRKWRFWIALAFLLPILVCSVFRDYLIPKMQRMGTESSWSPRLD